LKQLIKLTSFSNSDKLLKIEDNALQFDSAKIQLQSVKEFKYGIEPIQVDMFFVGRKFIIDLKSNEENIKIIFKSYFGFSKNYFNNLFNNILNKIWQETAVRISDDSIEKVLKGETIVVGKCQVFRLGIKINNFLISWHDLTYKLNYNRLTINCKSNSTVWTNLYYIKDYNVDVLMAILDWLYKHQGLEEIEKSASHNKRL
jgi:hypothetical protein